MADKRFHQYYRAAGEYLVMAELERLGNCEAYLAPSGWSGYDIVVVDRSRRSVRTLEVKASSNAPHIRGDNLHKKDADAFVLVNLNRVKHRTRGLKPFPANSCFYNSKTDEPAFYVVPWNDLKHPRIRTASGQISIGKQDRERYRNQWHWIGLSRSSASWNHGARWYVAGQLNRLGIAAFPNEWHAEHRCVCFVVHSKRQRMDVFIHRYFDKVNLNKIALRRILRQDALLCFLDMRNPWKRTLFVPTSELRDIVGGRRKPVIVELATLEGGFAGLESTTD